MSLQITDWLRQFGSDNADLQFRLIGSVVVIIALLLARLIFIRLVNQRANNQETRYRWRKAADYLVYIFDETYSILVQNEILLLQIRMSK